jgi:hypothetical protein
MGALVLVLETVISYKYCTIFAVALDIDVDIVQVQVHVLIQVWYCIVFDTYCTDLDARVDHTQQHLQYSSTVLVLIIGSQLIYSNIPAYR